MDVRIETPEAGKKELFIGVEPARLTPKFEKAYQDYKKKIVIGGFRKGKVPVALIKQMFGKSIREEVIDGVIPEFSQEAIDENNLKIIPPAKIDDVDYDDKKGLTFKVLVELQPEVELKKITGFEFEREIFEVDDAAIERTLNSIREQHATMETVEREAEEQDYILADLQEVDAQGVPIVGQKFEDQYFRIDKDDEASYKLSHQFIGAKAGEQRRVEFDMSEVNPEKEEPTFFEATIKDVKTKILPALDDEFAKDVGEYETLQELKDSVVKNLTQRLKQENYQRFQSVVLDKIVKENFFEVPEKLVDLQIEMVLRNMRQYQQDNPQFDEATIREQYRPDAVWGLKWQMIRDKIVASENLELTEEDFEAYYKEQAEIEEVEVDRIRNRYLNEDAKKQIEPNVLERKVVDFIVSNSKVTEKTVPYSETMERNKSGNSE